MVFKIFLYRFFFNKVVYEFKFYYLILRVKLMKIFRYILVKFIVILGVLEG